MVRFHTAAVVLTWAAACGSGSSGSKSAPPEPPKPVAQTTAIASVPIDAPAPEPDVPRSPPPELACSDGTALVQAPPPDPTWACTRPDGTRHGRFVTRFPDDSIAIKGAYQDGELDGVWERHHPNGTIVERGAYAAGKKAGHWTQANPSGALLGEYDMVAGTGIEKRWLDDGTRYSEIGMRGGVRHGGAKIFAPDGSIMEGQRYAKGLAEGTHAVGTRQTMRIEEKFARGVRTGPRSIWQFGLRTADENYDRRGKLDGAYTLWRSSKIMRVKGQFSHGKRTGPWVWNDRDGNKEREGSYVEGKKDGWWIEWADKQVVFTGNYDVGRPDGDLTYFDKNANELGTVTMHGGSGVMMVFYPNHKPAMRQRLIKGVEDGVYQELTNKGKVVVEGFYRSGVKHGAWKEWTPDGVLVLEQLWKKGKLDGVVKKYVDGKLSLEATYADGKAQGPYVETRDGKRSVVGQFVDDRRTGTWTHYSPDGSVVLQATYKAGMLDGPWRQLDDGGVLEGQIAAGRRIGTWSRTDKTGSVRKLTYAAP